MSNWYVKDFLEADGLAKALQDAENEGFDVHHVTQNGGFYTVVARKPHTENVQVVTGPTKEQIEASIGEAMGRGAESGAPIIPENVKLPEPRVEYSGKEKKAKKK